MQINLQYHPYAFGNLNIALDPAANVAYGCAPAGRATTAAPATGARPSPSTIRPIADLGSTYQAKVEDLWEQARADAAYASWEGDTGADTAERARAWDIASPPMSMATPTPSTYTYSLFLALRGTTVRGGRWQHLAELGVAIPTIRVRWQPLRAGTATATPAMRKTTATIPIASCRYPYEPGPWHPVGTSQFQLISASCRRAGRQRGLTLGPPRMLM